MKKLLKCYDIGALISFCAMFCCIGVEVISRNIIMLPTTWAEEMGRFFCVWSVFLGSASAWYRGSHIAIAIMVTRLTGSAKQALIWFVEVACAMFLIAIWVGTLLMMYESYETTTTALEMSISFFYLGLFLGLTGMVIFSCHRIGGKFKRFRLPDFENPTPTFERHG